MERQPRLVKPHNSTRQSTRKAAHTSSQQQAKPLSSTAETPRAPDATSDVRNIKFTQSQVAVALSIIKSKPQQMGIRDYCSHLRKRIRLSDTSIQKEHHFIDGAQFWKDQCKTLHDENRALQDKVASLELLARPEDYTLAAQRLESALFAGQATRKRKVLEDEDNSSDSTCDEDECTGSVTKPQVPLSCHIKLLPLLKSYHSLSQLSKDNDVTADRLIVAIQTTLTQMASTVRDLSLVNSAISPSIAYGRDKGTQMCSIIAVVFEACLTGLTHLCRDINGRRSQGQVVHALIQSYANISDCLHSACTKSAIGAKIRRKTSNQVAKAFACSEKETGSDETIETISIVTLTKLLVSLLRLPGTPTVHAQVLEGMCAMLLDRIGTLVSMVVFKEHIPSSTLPAHISTPHNATQAPENPAFLQIECQAFAWILKQAFGDGEERLWSRLVGTNASSIVDDGDDALLKRARKRVQKTLMTGVFGDHGNEFSDRLKLIAREEGLRDSDVVRSTSEPGAGLIETAWSVLGWDLVLGSSDD